MIIQTSQAAPKNYDCLYTIGHQTTDLYLTYCGMENCLPTHSYGPVWRKEYVLHFILGGHGYLTFYSSDSKESNREYELCKNQAFLIPPYVTTKYHADPENPYFYVWIGFSGEKAADYLKQTPLTLYTPVCTLSTPATEFQNLIQKMLDIRQLNLPNEIKRTAYLYKILSLLASMDKSSDISKIPSDVHTPQDYITLALTYISNNYDHITVSDIVEYIGVTRSWLYTLFKRELHTSPQEYLISFRLKKALQLLQETSLSLDEIADKTGYSETQAFAKAFKQRFQISPTAWRKIYRQKERRGLSQ